MIIIMMIMMMMMMMMMMIIIILIAEFSALKLYNSIFVEICYSVAHQYYDLLVTIRLDFFSVYHQK